MGAIANAARRKQCGHGWADKECADAIAILLPVNPQRRSRTEWANGRWHHLRPPSGLRTHALDSHVAKLGVLLTFLVSRLPLRVIPPFL